MHRAVICAGIICALVPASAGAQPITFSSNVGLVVIEVRVDRTAAFERVMTRLVAALRGPAATAGPDASLSLRLLRSAPGSADGLVRYVLMAEPVVPGVDYSLEHLLRTWLPAEADVLLRELRSALAGQRISVLDLQSLAAVSPTDRLRARLEGELRDQLAPGAQPPAAAGPAPALDALRGTRWSADGFAIEVTAKTATQWRLKWSGAIRNVSLVESLSGTVIVELLDAQGTPLDSVRQPLPLIAPQNHTALSGEIAMRADRAARVAGISVRVEPAP